ncbi:MAG TPA: DUF72 domain-containing protein [Caulobacteraceae bacterium]|nr:DUF72 domain-containing protein [Caulobacteraceae bacterium]
MTETPLVCEPRHASWFTPEADALLTGRRISRAAADPVRAAGAGVPGGWLGLRWRLHGAPRVYYSDYAAPDLEALASGAAAANALAVRGLVGEP